MRPRQVLLTTTPCGGVLEGAPRRYTPQEACDHIQSINDVMRRITQARALPAVPTDGLTKKTCYMHTCTYIYNTCTCACACACYILYVHVCMRMCTCACACACYIYVCIYPSPSLAVPGASSRRPLGRAPPPSLLTCSSLPSDMLSARSRPLRAIRVVTCCAQAHPARVTLLDAHQMTLVRATR